MTKPDVKDELDRINNMSPGGKLGGTKFGQSPGEASQVTGANPAVPDEEAKKAEE